MVLPFPWKVMLGGIPCLPTRTVGLPVRVAPSMATFASLGTFSAFSTLLTLATLGKKSAWRIRLVGIIKRTAGRGLPLI